MKKILEPILLALSFGRDRDQNRDQNRGFDNDWHNLGNSEASGGRDHDTITIHGPYDYYRKIKFRVKDSPLNMHRLGVSYYDGAATEQIEVRNNIPKGGESREIDLRGGKRKLKSVEFWYDDQGFLNGRADLILFGLK